MIGNSKSLKRSIGFIRRRGFEAFSKLGGSRLEKETKLI
jgi:hypothetical protein